MYIREHSIITSAHWGEGGSEKKAEAEELWISAKMLTLGGGEFDPRALIRIRYWTLSGIIVLLILL